MLENVFVDFINNYGYQILYAIVVAIGGYLGFVIKNIYQKYINDKTKKSIAKTIVSAVEQMYKDLDGEEKLNFAITSMSEMLAEKGITISEIEIRMLLEAAVGEANKVFEGRRNSSDEKLPEESGTVDIDINKEQ